MPHNKRELSAMDSSLDALGNGGSVPTDLANDATTVLRLVRADTVPIHDVKESISAIESMQQRLCQIGLLFGQTKIVTRSESKAGTPFHPTTCGAGPNLYC